MSQASRAENVSADPTDGDTRQHVMRLLLKSGPITAAELGEHLGLSAAGVRRHLDILVEEGLAEVAPGRSKPGRGRPAKHFRLTDAGRAEFGHDYDELASAALDALRTVGGPDAVRQFARARVDSIVDTVDGVGEGADDDTVEETARKLAETFDEHGYAATVTRVGNGIQICQHHCPVAHVAAEHPELCQAEHEAIAAKVGLHIQPLALIKDGNGVCTTNIPLVPAGSSTRQ